MNPTQVLASRSVLAVKPDGERLTLTPTIGMPYEVSPQEWVCPAILHGLDTPTVNVHGIDAWQAIQLAYELLTRLLGDFVDEGGALYWPGTEEPMKLDELLPKARLKS
jgi:hypothetical protein